MIVTRTAAETRATLAALPRPLGFTPTMGALHDGHLALVAAARTRCAAVAASIFVNPTQFGASEDYAVYPRDETRDLALLEEHGVDVVFVPSPAEMYPDGFATALRVHGRLAESYEGASRPGHFDGVALVVTKLLGIVRPDLLFLGQKDAQQVAVVRRVARDLELGAEVIAVPTVRDPDGLAMSSRNAYLTPDQRAVAPNLYRALLAGRTAAGIPGAAAKDVIVAATAALLLADPPLDDRERVAALRGEAPPAAPSFDLEYLAIVDPDTFEPRAAVGPGALLIIAARLGATRLIDNVSLSPSAYPAEDATT